MNILWLHLYLEDEMKKYAINFSFKNGTVICIKGPETDLEIEDIDAALTSRNGLVDEYGSYYGINMENLNYYTIYELRDSEVEEEETSHPEA